MSQFIFPPLTASLDSEQTNGGSLPAKQMVIAGYDSTATRVLLTDSSGRLEINAVVSLPLPSGAATSALQTAGNNILTTINTSLDNIEADADTSAGAVKNIQSPQGTTDAGLPALVVRNDTLADLSGADGDYTPLQVNATGALYTDVTGVLPGVGATNLGKAIQSAQGTTDVGVAALVVRNDTCADLAGADHDYAPLQVNNVGQLYTFTTLNTSTNSIGSITDISNSVVPGVGAANLGKAMGDAHGATHTGVASLVVRNDTLADLAGADHDYAPLQVNASGALYTTVSTGSIDVTSIVPGVAATSLGKAIQSAQGTTDTGVAALVVRNDTLADLAGSDHDYAPLQVNATGALYTSLATAIPAGTATIGKVDVNAIAPVDFLTAGVVDSSTLSGNIPTSGSSELVTNLAADCTEIEVIDDIGEFMSLGAEASTGGGYSKKCYLPLGGGRVKVSLSAGDGIILYSETGTTISSGKIAINFLG
jgi:hypothetical protein